MKKETLEEAKKYAGLSYYGDEVDAFVRGVKWQQEQDKNKYSELVDLLERLTTIYKENSDLHQKYDKQRLNLIEQIKKK